MRLIIPPITLIIAVIVLSACTLALDPELVQAELGPTQTPEPLTLETTDNVPRISVGEAKAHFDNGTALFVDSRRPSEYKRAHIAGAVLAYSDSTDALEHALETNQLIITYCT